MATQPADEGTGVPAPTADPVFEDLPETVRSRVLALTAEVLGRVAGLPVGLRRVAEFAPARRARAGRATIVAALADDDLRRRVGTQVAALPARGDEVDHAARAWLIRDEGWAEVVDRAVDPHEGPLAAEMLTELERLRERLGAADGALREARAKSRAQLDALKEENATLRRRLGDARAAERQARTTAQRAEESVADATRRLESLQAAQDKELRRLRARVEQLEAEQAAQRRSTRSIRDEATLRARLLLDTLTDAAAGLRRELALPQVSGSPADRVEAALAEPLDDARAPGAAGALGPTSPVLLEQWLALPRARLIVDGYNVSKSAWESQSLETQRQRLLRGLAPVVARTGAETTVVFDAARVTSRPVVTAPRGVRVLFSPPGVIADAVIADLVAAEPTGRIVVVVSDDGEVVQDARAAGARSASSSALVELITRG